MDLPLEEEPKAAVGAPAWMATFADMSLLLLCFFVLLLSFSQMDITKFQAMLGSIKEAMGVQFQAPGSVMAMNTTPVELSDRPSFDKIKIMELDEQLLMKVQKIIAQKNLADKVDSFLDPRGVVVRVKDALLFPPGSATVKPQAKPVLAEIAKLCTDVDQRVLIEGHTDSAPINTAEFPSNWALSTARANAVLRHLIAESAVPVAQLGIAGYADVRPLAPNDTLDNRAKNRRVEFIFERNQMKPATPGKSATSPEKSAPASKKPWKAPEKPE